MDSLDDSPKLDYFLRRATKTLKRSVIRIPPCETRVEFGQEKMPKN